VLLTNSRRCAVQRTRVYLIVVEKGVRIDAGPVVVEKGVRIDAGPVVVEKGARIDAGPVVVKKGARIDAGPVVVDVRLDDADVRTTDLVLKRGSGTESCG